jgi:hypothetical protein
VIPRYRARAAKHAIHVGVIRQRKRPEPVRAG